MNRYQLVQGIVFLFFMGTPSEARSQGGTVPSEAPALETAGSVIVASAGLYHLGEDTKESWQKFVVNPEPLPRLELEFPARRNTGAYTLELSSGDVRSDWEVRLNGKALGRLENTKDGKGHSTQRLNVPPGSLRAKNRLTVASLRSTSDDIYVGRVLIYSRTPDDLKGKGAVEVEVRDAASGHGIPCRLTCVRERELPALPGDKRKPPKLSVEEKSPGLAVRRGVLYTMDGKASFGMDAGFYRLYATRGSEYEVAEASLVVVTGRTTRLRLRLERALDTSGYLAADTHIHTVTHSGHGDATVEERVVTLAGEGVEVAIATDHNHHTDYTKKAREIGVQNRFLSVIGNEFTTDFGHLNAFPIDPDSKPAPHKGKDWSGLLEGLRATPGVEVVICNHPRRQSFAKGPFGHIGMDPDTGAIHPDLAEPGFDAVEIIDSKTLQKDDMVTLRDWFALLNHGWRLAAVAGSDSHSVGQIVGQGRTYVRTKSDDPSRVTAGEIAESFKAGRLLVSLGLLVDVTLDASFKVGDLAVGLNDSISVKIHVQGPSWTRTEHVALYLNGELAHDERVTAEPDGATQYHATWTLPRPRHDAHLVVVARGPAPTAPFWRLPEDDRYVLGVTNPIWLDGDADGQFTSARGYAEAIVEQHRAVSAIQNELEKYDAPVRLQLAHVLHRRLSSTLSRRYADMQEKAGKQIEVIFARNGEPETKDTQRVADLLERLGPVGSEGTAPAVKEGADKTP